VLKIQQQKKLIPHRDLQRQGKIGKHLKRAKSYLRKVNETLMATSDLQHLASFRRLVERAGILRERLKCEREALEAGDDISGFVASEQQEDHGDENGRRSLAAKIK
jgi:hypothetical protein